MNDLYGHWIYNGPDVDLSKMAGFVYCIEFQGRKYIGRKYLVNKITKKALKGKKRKRRFIEESDWRTYTGSCESFNMMLEKEVTAKAIFEILAFYPTRSLVQYFETKEILMRDALLDPIYYNQWISYKGRFRK